MNYIGLMSGTSLDGVDAVIYDPINHELKASDFMPYPKEIRQACERLIVADTLSFEMIARLEYELAELYAKAVNQLMAKTDTIKVSAIGCHGQTIQHATEAFIPYSIQLGNPFALANATGLPVVSHFRQKDMVIGGQGAPLAPLFHASLFSLEASKVVVNIGGIANLSYIDETGNVRGFDTGPGNVLLDAWVQKHCEKPFDEGGKWASQGKLIDPLLTGLLEDPYFQKPAPKSLDKAYFSYEWLQNKLEGKSYLPKDIQATLSALTVLSIKEAIKRVTKEVDTIVLCGGGAHNIGLVDGLASHFKTVLTTDALGFDSHYIEAMMIAWYAHKCFHHEALNLTKVTGSHKAAVHGAIVYP